MTEIRTEEIEKELLPQMLQDNEFCTKLDEAWKFSHSTGKECGIAAYLGSDTITFSDIIEGEEHFMSFDTAALILDGLADKKGIFYFFAHTHPGEEYSLLPSPSDLEALFDVRKGFSNLGIGVKPVHAILKPRAYRDQSSLQMVLYQEKSLNPIMSNKRLTNRTIKQLILINSLPTYMPGNYEVAPGEFIEIQKHLPIEGRVRMLNDSTLLNAHLINYCKDERVNNGIPYTHFNYGSLDTFSQNLEVNFRKLKLVNSPIK